MSQRRLRLRLINHKTQQALQKTLSNVFIGTSSWIERYVDSHITGILFLKLLMLNLKCKHVFRRKGHFLLYMKKIDHRSVCVCVY